MDSAVLLFHSNFFKFIFYFFVSLFLLQKFVVGGFTLNIVGVTCSSVRQSFDILYNWGFRQRSKIFITILNVSGNRTLDQALRPCGF